MGARLDGPRVWEAQIAIGWEFTDAGSAGRCASRTARCRPPADRRGCAGEDTLTRAAFDAILIGEGDGGELFASGAIAIDGDGAKLGELLGLLDEGDPSFAIVTP